MTGPPRDLRFSVGSGRRRRRALTLALGVAGCALLTSGAAANTALDEARAKDPYERLNRVFFYANGALDFLIIRPAAITFKRVAPRPMREGLANAFSNMGEPTVAINDVLQGHGKAASHTVARFLANSTLGVAGLLDVAAANGLPHHDNDFGITLARGGVRSGPYIIVPVLGPATLRDAFGELGELLIDPFTYLRYPQSTAVGVARGVDIGLDQRAASDKQIKTILASATDVYASIRSYYLQDRESQIAGKHADLQALPTFDDAAPAH
jgi:phospholipid-binding lipoprotein MlaA